MEDPTRPDPDALLDLARREGRGRLKVFLGAAPGVGKTFEMLAEARRRQAGGAEVLVGIVETHGRAAHTSRAHLGVNAISAAARVVSALEERLLPQLKARAHPLAGPALLTPAVIGGGVAPNIVPDRCRLLLDLSLIHI